MGKQVRFRKVPLEMLIETLTHLYNSGANYIDIVGVENVERDVVTISVKNEYMDDGRDSDDIPNNVEFINNKLSDEDINNLLDE
jgi:hypothetical protein